MQVVGADGGANAGAEDPFAGPGVILQGHERGPRKLYAPPVPGGLGRIHRPLNTVRFTRRVSAQKPTSSHLSPGSSPERILVEIAKT